MRVLKKKGAKQITKIINGFPVKRKVKDKGLFYSCYISRKIKRKLRVLDKK